MRQREHDGETWRWWAVWLGLLVIIAGCANGYDPGGDIDAGRIPADGGAFGNEDGAGPAYQDAASADVGPAHDGAAQADAGPPTYDSENGVPGGAGCFDFTDGDRDGELDCDDDDCVAEPVCCVGSSAAACCTAVAPAIDVDLRACAGTGEAALRSCVPAAALFGAPLPELRSGGMIPQGDDMDSGLALEAQLDPRVERIELRARIRASASCGAGCLDHVVVGLIPGATGTVRTVDASIELMVSGAQGLVNLIVGPQVDTLLLDDVAAAAGVDRVEPIDYVLSVLPDGVVSLRAGTLELTSSARWAPIGPARVAIYGRTTNPGSTGREPTALEQVTITPSLCDVPSSMARRGAPILPDDVDGWWTGDEALSAPSVVTWLEGSTPHAEMAFVMDGAIYRAQGIADGRFRATPDPHLPGSALVQAESAEAWRARAVKDPELVRDEAGGRWVLYFVGVAEDGTPTIARALGAPGFAFTFGTPEPLAAGYDGPSHFVATIGGGPRELLAVRRQATTARDTTSEIVLLGIDDTGLSPHDGVIVDAAEYGGEIGGFVHRSGRAAGAFDADEVAAPSIVSHRGVLRLYFAGRRGTRWAIGALLSEDAVHWQLANGGAPIFLGTGGNDFDALGVLDPEVVVHEGALRLYYAGTDLAAMQIGMSAQPAAETL